MVCTELDERFDMERDPVLSDFPLSLTHNKTRYYDTELKIDSAVLIDRLKEES